MSVLPVQESAKVHQYDRTYRFGNSTVHIVAPDITDFERKRRLEEVQSVIRQHVSTSLAAPLIDGGEGNGRL